MYILLHIMLVFFSFIIFLFFFFSDPQLVRNIVNSNHSSTEYYYCLMNDLKIFFLYTLQYQYAHEIRTNRCVSLFLQCTHDSIKRLTTFLDRKKLFMFSLVSYVQMRVSNIRYIRSGYNGFVTGSRTPIV